MFVVKHTDHDQYIRFRKIAAFWVDEMNEATQFETRPDAEIEIRSRNIPYVHVVPLLKDPSE